MASLLQSATLDIGGDKIAAAMVKQFGESVVSAFGLRGIRLSLAKPEILESQFRAILRAGAHGNVRILLPMVTTAAEVRKARDIMARAARKLKRRGFQDFPPASTNRCHD